MQDTDIETFSENPRLAIGWRFPSEDLIQYYATESFEVDGIVYKPPPRRPMASERRGGGGFFSIKQDRILYYNGEFL